MFAIYNNKNMGVLFVMACIAMSEKMWIKINNPSEHEKQITIS